MIDSPFIIHLITTYHSHKQVYFLMKTPTPTYVSFPPLLQVVPTTGFGWQLKHWMLMDVARWKVSPCGRGPDVAPGESTGNQLGPKGAQRPFGNRGISNPAKRPQRRTGRRTCSSSSPRRSSPCLSLPEVAGVWGPRE